MDLRRFLPLLLCVMLLAGCYRQASDEFTQVNSQNVQAIASPTEASSPTPAETEVDAESGDETSQPANPSKTPEDDTTDLTLPTDIPLVTSTFAIPPTGGAPLVPTATEPHIITPEPPPGQIVQPTVIPLTATPTFNLAPPTPTSPSDVISASDECVYEIASGDNLFRIAINHGTTVEALKSTNNLVSDNIQPGDLLRIPGCVPGSSSSNSTQSAPVLTATSSVGGSSVATVEPADGVPSGGEQIHVVVSGETLGAIASRYGLSVEAIARANNITDINSLSVGQELVIPAGN